VRRATALFPLFLAALVAAGCGTGGKASSSADAGAGKTLFQSKCAACHTLADANAQGKIGPNLDEAFAPDRQQGFKESSIDNLVLDQIRFAQGTMPPNIVQGQQAQEVAAYVAKVAGTGAAPSGGGTKVAATDGKSIFVSAGCSGCHTLKAAGATGTVGPNLDQKKPPEALVVQRVTNGKGAMPSFKGKLTPAQIQAVAKFVSSVAGK
jgi:cbb3-type cytochrome c oxidase subunit III